jgi:DNA-binding LacI/PurR family transcriptional regulator
MKTIPVGGVSGQEAATINEVARFAGVSTATVSRFLRGDQVRSAEAIRAAIERLGYRPTLAARSLRSGIHYAVAMIVPDIVNPYFSSLAKGVESVFRDTPYRVFLCNTDEQSAVEDAVLDEVMHRVDGIILAPAVEQEDAPTHVRKQGMPIVLVDRELADKSFDSVLVDNGGGAGSAARHLCDLGHTRIAIISGPLSNTPGRVRYSGFMDELNRRGIFPPEEFVQFSNFKESGGQDAMHRLMQLTNRPTAVFCANNSMTIGALKTLKELGVAIGREISVIGFDDLDLGPLLDPPLTVIDRPSEEQGARAARLLLRRLAGTMDEGPEHIILPTRLIVRASCVPPPPERCPARDAS